MNSCHKHKSNQLCASIEDWEDVYLSDICALFPYRGQEINAREPLRRTQSRLARKVVQVRYQSLEYVLQARIWRLRVYALHIFCYVVDRQVFQDGHVDFWWHDGSGMFSELWRTWGKRRGSQL